MMTTTVQDYQRFRDKGTALLRKGELQEAATLYGRAYEVARELGKGDLEDRALCNWLGVRLSFENCDAQLPRLRQILNRNSEKDTCHLAAWHLANAYYETHENKKGLFYARIALTHAQAIGNGERMATSQNLLGTLLVAESYFEEGLTEFRTALEIQGDLPDTLRALIVQNVGYCHLMLGRPRQALRLLYESLRVLRRHPLMAIQAHLDLALALLEVDKYSHAIRHSARALAFAEEAGRRDETKNALYLLGEAANLLGDEEFARNHFAKLQEFYPDTPFLPDFLLATDIRQMVNLRA